MKAIQLLLNAALPEELRDYHRTYDAKSVGDLMSAVAKNYPEKYSDIAQLFGDTGRNAAWDLGTSIRLKDFHPVIDKEKAFANMDAEVERARQTSDTVDDFKKKRMSIWMRHSDKMEKDTSVNALAQDNNIANAVVSGARGKSPQLKGMVTTPGLYSDYKGRPIPIFVRHSFGEGLRPTEFMAGTFGARTSVISTKNSTAKGGDFGKQLAVVATPLVVTEKDCGTSNGIDLPIDRKDLSGRVLVKDTAGIPAGTILDRHALDALRKKKVENVLVRSAMTCQSHAGLCSKCLGADGRGKLPHVGYAAGISAAQAVSEPVTQSALNVKHTGGAVSGGKRVLSGFSVINQIAQSPEEFPDRAAVSEVDGHVSDITKAPQGGTIVHVGDKEHYVPVGYDLMVKKGDKVEAGDQLADGIVDPGDITRLRGLGEGRRFYADRLGQALTDSGLGNDPRNLEILATAAINHAHVTDPDGLGDYLPDDTANYAHLAATYTPPKDTQTLHPSKAVGKYLQAPALHYTIGTKLTPKMAAHLHKAGMDELHVSDDAPGFEPEMIRLRTAPNSSQDWFSKLTGSYLGSNLSHSAVRGEDTNVEHNIHYAPVLASGVSFGKNVETTGEF